jgi:general secretion pathway protein C
MNAASWLEGLPAPDKWRDLLLTHGPRIATWTLAVLLAIQAAVIVTGLGSSGRSPSTGTPISPGMPRHVVNIASITNAELFGKPPVAAVQDAAHAPQSTMPLVLTGIISADDPQYGLAILGQTAQSTKVFAVGDNVPGGAKLHSVYNDRVVIDRGGHLETLVLPRQTAPGAAPPPTAAVLNTESPVADRMRKLITEQPSLITDVMRPQPVFANGKQTGYRVYPGRNRQAFLKLGLRPGDLVTAINGTPLDDRDRGEQILRTLSSSSEARVTVIRSGQTQDLTLNIAQVEQEADSLATSQAAQAGAMPPPVQAAPAPPPPPGGDPGGQ